jgi:hypothetical protein
MARLILFARAAASSTPGIVVQRVLGLRNLSSSRPRPAAASAAWYAQRWMDADGNAWQEIDLARLAHDPAFLQVGAYAAGQSAGTPTWHSSFPGSSARSPRSWPTTTTTSRPRRSRWAGGTSPAGYDPLASVSIMEQLRTAQAPRRRRASCWLIGNLPSRSRSRCSASCCSRSSRSPPACVWLDTRIARSSRAGRHATEMQMLSQRLARGSALAAQGQAPGFAAVRRQPRRVQGRLRALVDGGTVKGVTLDRPRAAVVAVLERVKARWERVDVGAEQALDQRAAA